MTARATSRWLSWVAIGLLLPRAASAGHEAVNPLVTQSGDALQIGLPLAALGLTFLLVGEGPENTQGQGLVSRQFDWTRMDGSPRHDLALAITRTELLTYGLKYGVNAERPNGGGQSFPSGHTSIAFASAEFMRKEYGWGWGIPAYLVASYVGWSRVESEKHWPRDVWAGAAIGVLSNHDLGSIELPFGSLGLGTSLLTSQLADPATLGLTEIANPSLFDAAPRAEAVGLTFELKFW